MKSTLAILTAVCFIQVYGNTIVEIDRGDGSNFGNVEVSSKNKNANVNDINIGSGNGGGNDGSLKIPNINIWDTDEVNINWSADEGEGKTKCTKPQDAPVEATTTTAAPPAANPTDPTTTTTAAPTTTISPYCFCTYSDGNANTGTCHFYADDVQAHCDQKGYSMCRAVCVTAMALWQEQCTPMTPFITTTLHCYCPILNFRGSTYTVPYDVPSTSRLFYDARYKACYRQCRDSSETEESTYESGYTGKGNKKKLL